MMYRPARDRWGRRMPMPRPPMSRHVLEQNYSRRPRGERPLYALSDPSDTPFDLNDAEVIAEIKAALIALARYETDPFRSGADPATEQVWKQIVTEGPLASAWDGPTSDEFVAAISRYATEPVFAIAGPFFQLGGSSFGRYGIVGGPQPTAAGLEVLAGAVNEKLGGEPAMKKYLAWRGGVFAPPSQTSGPPATAVVIPNRRHGVAWRLDGYTPVYPEGDPTWVGHANTIDQHLVECWQQLAALPATAPEATRTLLLQDCILQQRSAHDAAAREANKSAPTPSCPAGQIYDRYDGRCREPGTLETPEVALIADVEGCVEVSVTEDGMERAAAEKACMEGCIRYFTDQQGRSKLDAETLCGQKRSPIMAMAGAIAIGAALGLGAYFWQRQATRRPTPNRRRRSA